MVTITIKMTLEGTPDQVERLAAMVKDLFTVTYESKDRAKPHSPDSVIRYLRVQPPADLDESPFLSKSAVDPK